MPPKKTGPLVPLIPPPPKSLFFKPGAAGKAVVVAPAKPAGNSFFTRKQFTPRRSFLYDQFTDEPYAEWIGNQAVCLETGEVLFESNRGSWDDGFSGKPSANVKFDFSPPEQKHPKDPSIASQDLIDAGILTLEDFRNGNAGLTAEAFERYMSMPARCHGAHHGSDA
jgi:hypothetical protein